MKTFLKMGLILFALFCLSPLVSAQFIETHFLAWSPDGGKITVGHQDLSQIIFSLAWSPDGSKIAVGRFGKIEILDATNQTVLKTLTGSGGAISEVDWSSDSTKVAAASSNPNGLAVWNVATEQMIAARQVDAISVSWNPDNVRIASASIGGGIGIWDTTSGQITLPQLFGSEVEWSPEGNKLASAWYDEAPITVTNITTRQTLFTLPGHANGVTDVKWSPNGANIASGGVDNNVRVWNATTGAQTFVLTGHTGVVTSVAWNSNNTTLASGSGEGTVRIWDTQSGQLVDTIHTGGQVRSIDWSPDGTKLAYGNPDGTITIIPAPSALPPAPIETPFIAWSPDGSKIAAGHDTSLQILDADSLQVLNTISDLAEQTAEASWSPDGTRLAIVNDADVQIWQMPWSSAFARELITYRYYEKGTPGERLVGVDTVVWSPDGTRLASNLGRSIDIWKANDSRRIHKITDEWDRVTDLIWTSDNRLAVASVDAWIIMLNPDTGSVINYFYSPTTPSLSPGIWSIALSPDGNQIVMGYGDGLMFIWGETRTTETLTTSPSKQLDGHTDFIGSVAWNTNGRYIASGSRDGTVRIWDAETGDQLQVIKLGANVQVNSVAWSPDGTKLAYGNPDGTITIIPAPTSAATPTPTAHNDFIPPCPRICSTATATPGQ